MPEPIEKGTTVFDPENPGFGFGIVRYCEEDFLEGKQIASVAFEWKPGVETIPSDRLVVVPTLSDEDKIDPKRWGSAEELRERLGSALILAENSRTGSFLRTFVRPLPHQAFLMEKIVVHGRFGHLIADDVGMGKTIEAGLLIATQRQSDPQSRILVITPAGVLLQWQDEMDEHFGLSFSIAGRDFSGKRSQEWQNQSLVLASIDMIKREQMQDVLRELPPFDLVVCDEAHRLTATREFLSQKLQRTKNYRFVEWLVEEQRIEAVTSSDGRQRSPKLLLLTATPHQGDDLRFGYLLKLIRPDLVGEAEDAVAEGGAISDPDVLAEIVTRTAKKRAVDWDGDPIFKGHDSKTLNVDLSEPERAVLRRLARYVEQEMVFDVDDERGDRLVRVLAHHTFQKIAASSWSALEAAMVGRLGGKMEPEEEGSGASVGREFKLLGGEAEAVAIEEVIELIRAVDSNSKENQLGQLLAEGGGFRESGDTILIFTQYRQTQNWLQETLEGAGEKVALIHGGLSLDERRQQRAYFDTDATIMISTEAGSEGANMHRRCHLEINFDLPWNPMRLLQRIGRLGRYGQKHVVRVANLRAPSSWDAEISEKIRTKLETVQQSMGEVADEDYMEMILGEVHEAVSVPKLIADSDWGKNPDVIDSATDVAVQSVLRRKPILDKLYSDSVGMPEAFDAGGNLLGTDDFRQAFEWAAAGQGVKLSSSKTSEQKFLPGVYHFTLPDGFKRTFTTTKERYLVFDRDRFAEVRHEQLGEARGNPITPTLAGFGDRATDWFFESGVKAGAGRRFFSLNRPETVSDDVQWWIVFVARWKKASDWAGPDGLFALALDENGQVVGCPSSAEMFAVLPDVSPNEPGSRSQPSLDEALVAFREKLRATLPENFDRADLYQGVFAAIAWS